MRLVTAWLEFRAKQHCEIPADSARYLSQKLARAYAPSRIWEWEHDKRSTPVEVSSFMREELLPSLLDQVGFDDPVDRKRVMEILKVLF